MSNVYLCVCILGMQQFVRFQTEVGLNVDDLQGLFQPKPIYDSNILLMKVCECRKEEAEAEEETKYSWDRKLPWTNPSLKLV